MSTIDLYCTNGLSPPVRWPSRDPHSRVGLTKRFKSGTGPEPDLNT